MKRYMTAAAICGCLLIGSLYPKMLLQHQIKLVDEKGNVIETEDEINPELPFEVRFRFLEIWKSL